MWWRRVSLYLHLNTTRRAVVASKTLDLCIVDDLEFATVHQASECEPLRHICQWISRKPLEIEPWFQRTINSKWWGIDLLFNSFCIIKPLTEEKRLNDFAAVCTHRHPSHDVSVRVCTVNAPNSPLMSITRTMNNFIVVPYNSCKNSKITFSSSWQPHYVTTARHYAFWSFRVQFPQFCEHAITWNVAVRFHTWQPGSSLCD